MNLPFSFHLYGLMIGIAVWVGVFLIEKKWRERKLPEKVFWDLFLWCAAGAVVGARLWHVGTDFYLYQHALWRIFAIWSGGLSIFGAVAGAGLCIWLYIKLHPQLKLKWLEIADLAVFGLPFGQAIGRFGNYFNQELYGLPAKLPWAIYIDPAHRLPQYQHVAYYHPLFAYEMILMVLFGIWIWRRNRPNGQIFIYILYYATIRFLLDFLRPDKAVFDQTGLGINQVILLVILCITVAIYLWRKQKKLLLILPLIFLPIFLGGCTTKPKTSSPTSINANDLSDHQHIHLKFRDTMLSVEAVTTPVSWEEGLSDRNELGSDGMLFLFPQKQRISFWMQRMHFNLDMVWIDDGKVMEIMRNIPKPVSDTVPTSSLPLYTPAEPVNMVLEMNAGAADQKGLRVGDVLQLNP